MTRYQEEIARRVRKAAAKRDINCVVYVSDFSRFDAGREWNPEPIEIVFDYRRGDKFEDLESVLSKYSRVVKGVGVTATAYYVS